MFGFFGTDVNAVRRTSVPMMLFMMILQGSLVYANMTFHSSDIFSQTQCSSCTKDRASTAQRKELHNSVNNKQKILIFINPQCSWCHKALSSLNNFKKKHSHWDVQVYVMASLKEFVNFMHTELHSLPLDLNYTLDINGSLANEYGVIKTPTYIITKHDQQKRIEGYVDLGSLDFNGEL